MYHNEVKLSTIFVHVTILSLSQIYKKEKREDYFPTNFYIFTNQPCAEYFLRISQIISWSIQILSSNLCLSPKGLLPFRFLWLQFCIISHLSHACYRSAHIILFLHFMTIIVHGEENKLWNSSPHRLHYPPIPWTCIQKSQVSCPLSCKEKNPLQTFEAKAYDQNESSKSLLRQCTQDKANLKLRSRISNLYLECRLLGCYTVWLF
jgi:hypothetical protein